MMHAKISPEPAVRATGDGFSSAIQEWELPIDEAFLEEFLTYVFTTYWDEVNFGPLIAGASYEIVCPEPPTTVDCSNGFLTIHFGLLHFHLCVGEGPWKRPEGTPPPARLPARAVIQRTLDLDGAPISWGFDLKNQAGESMMHIGFATPFASRGDVLEPTPKWERLAMWRDIAKRYLGREPEPFDESGKGFKRLA